MKNRRILFVCLGNICRSPMAEGVFRALVKDRNLIQYFELDSAGTAAYHIGKMPDQRAQDTCRKQGIELSHKARQVVAKDFEYFDYVVAMDKSNYDHLKKMHAGNRILLMRDFDSEATVQNKDVPDPYYGGIEGFHEVYDILVRSSTKLLELLASEKM
jgi:protein-tyrosine phosphatase